MADTKPLIQCDISTIKQEIIIFLELLTECPYNIYKHKSSDIDITMVFWVYYIVKKYNYSLIIQNNFTNTITDSLLSWLIRILCPGLQIIYVDADLYKT